MNQVTRKPRKLLPMALVAVVVVLLSACTTYTDYSAFVHDPRPVVTTTDYRVAPPDVLVLSSKTVREVENHVEQIRPDGKITLPWLGAVYVAGMTPEEISALLTERYGELYKDCEVTARVTGFNSKRIFVFGEVSTPGPYEYNGANTVLGTLARAQPTRLADPSRIHILRPNKDGELIRRMTIDLDKMVKEGDVALDAVLEQGDIVYVPANALATVGLTFQQLLLPLQPIASTVQAPTSIDSSVRRSPYGSGRNTE